MNQNKRRLIIALASIALVLSGCKANTPSKIPTDAPASTQYEEETKGPIVEIIKPIEPTKPTETVKQEEIIEPTVTIIQEKKLSEIVKEAYSNFTGEEDYTILDGTLSQVKRLYEEVISILEKSENNTFENEEDIYLAERLTRALAKTDDITALIYNLHNLYVFEFFTVYPDEEAYTELYGELAKSCGNIDMVNSVYEEYSNLVCLLHLRTCPLKHTDMSLDTDMGYKYMYECEALPYGPENTYTIKLILK